jgi:polyvinyl alcohol dehydrogenase (cytochrome)
MSPERVLSALEAGTMAMIGLNRSLDERRAIASFVTGKAFGHDPGNVPSASAMCGDPGGSIDSGPQWNGWGVDLMNSRFQPANMAGLKADDVPRLTLKWVFGLAGEVMANAQPTVYGGRIFVGSPGRKVYSLNASTGCVYWWFDTESAVRSAITVGKAADGSTVAWFADMGTHVYALDAMSGKLLWRQKVDPHPVARVTGGLKLHGGRLYVPVSSFEELTSADPSYECCKFRGSLIALESATGKQIWKSYTISDAPKPTRKNKSGKQQWGPSGAGVWSSPTIDEKRKAIYVTTGDSYSDPPARTADAFIAFDLATGKLLWSRQMTAGDAFNVACALPDKTNCPEANGPDFDFGSSPILVDLANGKRALVAGQKSGAVHAVDPDQQGEVLWSVQVGKGGALGGIQWGSAVDRENIYVALSDLVYDAKVGETGPELELNPKEGGGMFALKLSNGERVWHTPPPGCGERKKCSPAQSAAVSAIDGAVFSGSVDGFLRAYSTRDGRIIWSFDTTGPHKTVNGVNASGGSVDGPGPVIAGGMVYVNSGYPTWGGMPGNVLLAFSVDGR